METISVANFISERIAFCEKTQVQIAKEIGLARPNFLTMVKQGKTKLPMLRVAAFAQALNVDPLYLLTMCIKEYNPDIWDAIKPFFPLPSATVSSAC